MGLTISNINTFWWVGRRLCLYRASYCIYFTRHTHIRQASKANFRACTRSLGLYFLGLLPVFMLFLSTLATQIERKVVEKWLGAQGADVFYSYVVCVIKYVCVNAHVSIVVY